ncbi:acetoacetate--CoA ligase [bacterium]|nr:acetoacetate--CoA ligase [bacterium]
MEKVFWQPQSQGRNSMMGEFAQKFASELRTEFKDYEELFQASVTKLPQFWQSYLKFSGLIFSGDASVVQAEGKEFFQRQFFPKLKLSYPKNLLRNYKSESDTVLVGLVENQEQRRVWTLGALKKAIAELQQVLKTAGVSKGDRVAALMPNSPETVIAMMAATGLGAIWSSCSPDFGEKGILDRFSQIDAKFLFVADQVLYNGKVFDLAEKNQNLISQLPTLKGHHTFKHLTSSCDEALNLASSGAPAGAETSQSLAGQASPEFLEVEFNHPLFIMFSSGTTGTPKCIVHGVGGTTLQHSKEHQLHCDLRYQEKLFYYSTCGWMMWNWLVGGMLQGAQVYCFDGSPAAPEADSIWQLAEREELAVFGTSAKFIGACRNQGLKLNQKFRFEKMRLVLSTGSPLLPEDFDYFYADVQSKSPVQLASISGGTDIISCFMLGSPMKPVVRGEIQARGLGMDVQAWNSKGEAVSGEQAELVCCSPFPSMPVMFWNDPDHKKFQKAYFGEFKNIWHHGDYVEIRENGGVVVYGRSDATLNPGGVRIGTAEIYRQVETHPLVADCIAVGKRIEGDEEVQLFVKFKDATQNLNDDLIKDLKSRIRSGASPRHVPKAIFKVNDIPYTVSGKKVEIAVKKVIHGEDPGNREALSNPESLEEFKKFL